MGQPGDMGTHTRFIPLGPGLLFPRPEMPSLRLGIQFRCHTLNSKLSYCFHSTRVNRHANVPQWISSSPLHCQHLRMGPRFRSPAVAQRVSPDTWPAPVLWALRWPLSCAAQGSHCADTYISVQGLCLRLIWVSSAVAVIEIASTMGNSLLEFNFQACGLDCSSWLQETVGALMLPMLHPDGCVY